MTPGLPQEAFRERRRAARRTAVKLGILAAAIFTAFILSGVLGR